MEHAVGVAPGEGARELLAQALLLLGEGVQRHLEITGHQRLHLSAVETDQLAKELDRKQVLLTPALLLEDDLSKNRARDVLVCLRVVDHEIDPLLDHLAEVLERDVGGGASIVESPVGVLLDHHAVARRLAGLDLFRLGAATRLRIAHNWAPVLQCEISTKRNPFG